MPPSHTGCFVFAGRCDCSHMDVSNDIVKGALVLGEGHLL